MLYQLVKKGFKLLLPKRLRFRIEPLVRRVLYLFYKGRNYQCNLCDAKLKTFVDNENKSCPKCGSIARDRRLFLLLKEEGDLGEILDFSPSRALFRKMKLLYKGKYFASDISGDFIADYSEDLTKLSFENDSFDTIVCYHVLEHIAEDIKAMRELLRVLRPSGNVYIQTPFKEGEIYEDYSVTSREERLKHFGQEDHVRVYSVEGLMQRLQSSGFSVNLLQFDEAQENLMFKSREFILKCTKVC